MNQLSFDSEYLKVDYVSLNLQFHSFDQINQLVTFLLYTFDCQSNLLDHITKKQSVLAKTNKNRYSTEFITNSTEYWKGTILRFRINHAQQLYKDLKFQKLDWSIFDLESTNLGQFDLCYDRNGDYV